MQTSLSLFDYFNVVEVVSKLTPLKEKYIIVVKLIVVIDKIILKILTYLVHDTQHSRSREGGYR